MKTAPVTTRVIQRALSIAPRSDLRGGSQLRVKKNVASPTSRSVARPNSNPCLDIQRPPGEEPKLEIAVPANTTAGERGPSRLCHRRSPPSLRLLGGSCLEEAKSEKAM